MNLRTFLSEAKRGCSLFWEYGTKRSSVLDELIRGVEESSGCERTEARARAKAWLTSHVASMTRRDIEVAREHFSYLLPDGWGVATP